LGTGTERAQAFLPSEIDEQELEILLEKKFKIPINVGPIGLINLNKFLNGAGDTTFGFR